MSENREMLITKDNSRQKKDARQRLLPFADWLTQNDLPWYLPDLDAYRDFLLSKGNLSGGSVAAHLGTIRTRYRTLLEDDAVIEKLHLLGNATENSAEFIALVLEKMKLATNKDSGRVAYKRLPHVIHRNSDQLDELLTQPDMKTLQGLRDVLAVGLIFCAGINEAELCALQVSDFLRASDGELLLHVPPVLEGVERTIPICDYILFSQNWIERYLASWLYYSGVKQGLLLRGFFRGGNKMNAKVVTSSGIQKMLKSYPIHDQNGQDEIVTTLELRRTHARWLFLAGVDFEDIQKSLGHNSSSTTLEYIGLPSIGSETQQRLSVDAEPLLDGLSQYWPGATSLSISSGEPSE